MAVTAVKGFGIHHVKFLPLQIYKLHNTYVGLSNPIEGIEILLGMPALCMVDGGPNHVQFSTK